ncbi:hypothetical protein QFZ75_007083 [Streptomyces sp. V3I8]|uniref:hypothetical protein n=1 Tax=Streptomyces sp. V3I8 TaxID=3042279 RepID=UPI00277DA518|nr:hypothetical protein [Streptomyces sp. V3I8]
MGGGGNGVGEDGRAAGEQLPKLRLDEIQRLFATGMTLQSAQRFVQHPQAAERLGRAVDDLDTTIKIIRSTIFGLRAHETVITGLRVRVVRALEEAVPVLGFPSRPL